MKKTNKTLLFSLILTSALTFFTVAPAPGEEPHTTKDSSTKIRSTQYDTDTIKFLYKTGRYMESAVAAKRILSGGEDFPGRNQVVLIKWLSDLKLGYTDLSFGFRSATFADLPQLKKVFEILYRRGDYETLVKLSEGVKGPLARYFQGLSLYANGNFNEAEKKLSKIPTSFDLYADAELVLSQIMITREDTESALKHLDLALKAALKTTKKNKDLALIDQIHLKTGYVLFNIGNYKEAETNFNRVARSDELKGLAATAKIWSTIKQGDCKGTLKGIDKLKPLSTFNKDSQELMILESYCMNKLGASTSALASLTHTIDLFQALESSYATVYIGGHLPRGIIELLDPLQGNSQGITDREGAPEDSSLASSQALFFLEGIKSAATADDSTILALAEDNYRALKTIASLYRKKEEEIKLLAGSLARKVKAKRSTLIFVQEHSVAIKEKLKRLSSLIEKKKRGILSSTPPDAKAEIIRRWGKHLNRAVTKLEEDVIDIVLLDGEEGIWYMNNTQYCQFLYWMAIDPTKAGGRALESDPLDNELGVIEKVIMDLETTSNGGETPYDILLPRLAPLVKEKNKDDEARLKALLKLEDTIHKNRIIAEKATEEVRLEIEDILVRRAGLMRFDIRSVLEKAFMLLHDIENEKARQVRQ